MGSRARGHGHADAMRTKQRGTLPDAWCVPHVQPLGDPFRPCAPGAFTPPRAQGHTGDVGGSEVLARPAAALPAPGLLSGTRGRKRLPGGSRVLGLCTLHLTVAVDFRVPGPGTAQRDPDTRRDRGRVRPGRTDGGDGAPCGCAGVHHLGPPLGGDCRPQSKQPSNPRTRGSPRCVAPVPLQTAASFPGKQSVH